MNATAYGDINITVIKIKNYKIVNKTYRYILNNFVASGFVIDRPVERGTLLLKKGEFVLVGMRGKDIVIIKSSDRNNSDRNKVLELWKIKEGIH